MITAREGPAAVSLDGKVYVMGGVNGSGALQSMEMYDPETDSWTAKASMPSAKTRPGSEVANGHIYVLGPPDSSVYAYDPASDSWSSVAPLPVVPEYLAIASISGNLYVTVGRQGQGQPSLYKYDPFLDDWERRLDHPQERAIASLGVCNGMVYAVGGVLPGQAPGAVEPTRIDRYDPANDVWTVDAIAQLAHRRTHLEPSLASLVGKMYVIGGWDGFGVLASVEAYDPWAGTWETEAPMPTARFSAAFATVGSSIFAIGGTTGDPSGWLATNEQLTLDVPGSRETPILFVSTRDGYYETYSIQGDGSRQQRLTNDSYAEWHATWTPGAKRILLSADGRGSFDLYSMNPDGSDWRRITTLATNDWRPSMSPDGTMLAFSGSDPNDQQVYLMDADGTDLRQLTHGPGHVDDSDLTWSPDSRELVVSSNRGGTWQLWGINVSSGDWRQLTDRAGEAFSPNWSPDGLSVAFHAEGDLWTVNPDGTGERRIEGPCNEHAPAWSPDGSRLAYSCFCSGATNLCVSGIDGTGRQTLSTSPELDGDPAWAPPLPEGQYPTPTARPRTIHLPVVLKGGEPAIALRNGGFELGTLAGWTDGGELPRDVRPEASHSGSYSALLGDPGAPPCQAPVGEAWIEQEVDVPSGNAVTLSLWYRIVSYDWNPGLADTIDHLEVLINGRRVVIAANQTPPARCDCAPHDSGWLRMAHDLSEHTGQRVTLRIRLASTDRWYNSWAYVDDISVRAD